MEFVMMLCEHASVQFRRAFQRALVVPGPKLEALWRQYEQFEQAGSNRALARRILDEQRPRCSPLSGCCSLDGKPQPCRLLAASLFMEPEHGVVAGPLVASKARANMKGRRD